MSKDIDKIVEVAAANVACESGEVSKETLQSIKEQLLGENKHSDQSFIYSLYRKIVDEEEVKNEKQRIKK